MLFPVPIFTIDRSQPFDPVKFIGESWRLGEQDERALTVASFSLDQAQFEHTLNKGESPIRGEDKLFRLQQLDLIRADAAFAPALLADYQENKENSVLEYLYRTKGVTWFDLPGTVLLCTGDVRFLFCLYRDGGGWHWRCNWLARDCSVNCPSLLFPPRHQSEA